MNTEIAALPFVAMDAAGGSIESPWRPHRTGDYAADCATGRDYAARFAAIANPTLLPWIVRSMPRGADFGAVEIGFLTALGERI